MREYLKAEIERHERMLDMIGPGAAIRCCAVTRLDTLRMALAHLESLQPDPAVFSAPGDVGQVMTWAVSPNAGLGHVRGQ